MARTPARKTSKAKATAKRGRATPATKAHAKRSIPEDVKQAVRKKCGFGCVICGLPIYHYDHVDGFATVQSHAVENMILLCPGHHQEKTSKRLSKEVVRRAAAAPLNLTRDCSAPHPVLIAGDRGRLEVGGNVYEFDFQSNADRFEAIRIRGVTVFGVSREDGYLLLDIILTDQNGDVILQVERGELTISTDVWDYRIEGQDIQIRSAKRSIDLELTLNDNGVTVRRGMFVQPSLTLLIEPTQHTLLPMRLTMQGNRFSNCRVGLNVE